jgi:hypothetical protein
MHKKKKALASSEKKVRKMSKKLDKYLLHNQDDKGLAGCTAAALPCQESESDFSFRNLRC